MPGPERVAEPRPVCPSRGKSVKQGPDKKLKIRTTSVPDISPALNPVPAAATSIISGFYAESCSETEGQKASNDLLTLNISEHQTVKYQPVFPGGMTVSTDISR